MSNDREFEELKAEALKAVDTQRPKPTPQKPADSEQAEELQKCPYCAELIKKEAIVCRYCGRDLLEKVQQPAPKSGRNRTTAALFAIFLGGVGVHKFYLGKTCTGVFYLIFCWTFLPAIIGFIEGLSYLTTSDDEFAKKYN